jgi:hypothetical protein
LQLVVRQARQGAPSHLHHLQPGPAPQLAHERGPLPLLGLPAALADATEDADAPVFLHDVVDQLGDEYRLARTGAAEQPGLPAPLQRGQDIDGLDARGKRL